MKTSIITITYDRDLEYLKYNLRSIKKFCKGYHENIVVIDDHENDCKKTQEYLKSIGQKYYINREAKKIQKGYIRQQYIKLFSEQYVSSDTDYICHVDSDNIFIAEHNPSVYFKNDLPILGITKWADMPQTFFKSCTDKTLCFQSHHNFMRRMPLVYHQHLFKKFRDYIEKHHKNIIDYLNSLETFSEYNAFGAFAYRFQNAQYYWIDTVEQKDLWFKELKLPCIQYSSKQNNTRYIEVEKFKNILN